MLVHREVMEGNLGRKLNKEDEVVHHINGNPEDNRIENLEVMTPSDHAKLHSRSSEMILMRCLGCGIEKEFLARQYRHNQLVQKKSGPFCSKHCAGVGFRALA